MILVEVFKLVVYVYRPFHWFWHLEDDTSPPLLTMCLKFASYTGSGLQADNGTLTVIFLVHALSVLVSWMNPTLSFADTHSASYRSINSTICVRIRLGHSRVHHRSVAIEVSEWTTWKLHTSCDADSEARPIGTKTMPMSEKAPMT